MVSRKRRQHRFQVGYLGPARTFTEKAARRFFGEGVELVPFPTIAAVFLALDCWEIDQGVVPIENSTEGTVLLTQNELTRSDVCIAGEVVLPIHHCLTVAPGTKREDIHLILSHEQTLGQCKLYLAKNFPLVRTDKRLSNAAAIEEAVRCPGIAALGPEEAAEHYGAQVLEKDIEDSELNATRFLVLDHRSAMPTGRDKTTIAFSLPKDVPGSLVDVLQILKNLHLNMTRIESRPSGGELGYYIFWMDFEGHHEIAKVSQGLELIRGKSDYYRLHGSYPKWVENREEGELERAV